MVNCVYFILVLTFFHLTKSNFNPDPTVSTLGLINTKGTCIVISPDEEDRIAVGFSDGTVKIFDLELN